MLSIYSMDFLFFGLMIANKKQDINVANKSNRDRHSSAYIFFDVTIMSETIIRQVCTTSK